LWLGVSNNDGYGAIKEHGKAVKSHRVSWRLANGDSGSLQVLHRCDQPACVNPAHLFLGTHDDNMRDKARKGRASRLVGLRAPNRKVSAEDVLEIRRLYAAGGWRQVDLAKKFGLKQPQVSSIVRRDSWTHL